tara:strand:- start:220 stop:1140 length:921 start_codon:yes stop_codon:yes gene_type:complete
MKKTFLINSNEENSRLDRWFKRSVCNVPQSLIEKNIRKGKIKVNNKIKKSSYKLKVNDEVKIFNINYSSTKLNKVQNKYIATKKEISKSSEMFIENNENFAVINKPSGIAVQSGTKSKRNILDILKSTKEFYGFTPYTVHRIDKETTGVFVVAKNRKYAQLFTSLFRIRKIYKTYLCIILGEMKKKDKGKFIDQLFTYEGDKKVFSKAITKYEVIDSNNNYSLLKLNPETGRKHQLRKQLLIRGYPILGDNKYRFIDSAKNKGNNLMLHSYKINFTINGIKHRYIADLTDIFKKTLNEKYLKIFQQ